MTDIQATKRSSWFIRFLRYWLPVVLVLSAIYFFSGDTFSDYNTRGRINRILIWLFPDISGHTLIWINYFIRKTAHFVEYGALTLLFFRAFRADSSLRWRFRWAAYSIALTVSWAFFDEYRQSFVPSRSGSVYDSMIDTAGGLFALATVYWLARRRDRRDVVEDNEPIES